MLKLQDVRKSFHDGEDELIVIAGADMHLRAGETVALLGDSGSGKSTFLQIAAGLEAPDSGQVLIDGRDLSQLSERELAHVRRRDVGFVFQQFNLIPGLDVRSNLLFQRRLNGLPDQDPWVDELVRGLELAPILGRAVEVLSGGQQQRVAIARALAHRPRLLFADEPTGNLHDALSRQVIELLCRFARESGAALLLVTHNREIAAVTQQQVRLSNGLLVPAHLAPDVASQ
ncbi:MAG: putative ABC transport system ATP-binding protein [Halieaceae bacterium]|jgi:putative ABC transport system ATP-binding protein